MRRVKGFTLVELIVVITIISILAVSATFIWRGPTINLKAQGLQVVGDIRFAQALSMTRGQRYKWVMLTTSTYQIQNAAGTAVTLTGGNTTVTLTSGVTFGTLSNLPNNLIAFDGKGAPYTDTGSPGIALATTATIPLTANGETHTISVSPETGRVILQ